MPDACSDSTTPAETVQERFGALDRLYGRGAVARLARAHVCVVGLGGVGSWAVEALARSAVGRLTLVDYDTVAASNMNRQLPALTSTLGEKKHAVLARRVAEINPHCACETVDDYLTLDNVRELMDPARGYDYVIDAMDSIKFKAGLIYCCRRNRIRIITTGAAGGLTDPTAVAIRDLTRVRHDPLAARVRAKLRDDYGWTRNPRRYFGVECVFSDQQQVYPRADGTVGPEKPGIRGVHLDCRLGYGSAMFVTAAFGLAAAGRVVNRLAAG